MVVRFVPPVLALVACAGVAQAQDPWADHVVWYQSGTLASPSYNDPSSATGSPARFTGSGDFAGAVTPFSPPWNTDQIVGIGPGGSLVLRFNEPVMNDPLNPFGVDLLIFGNTGYESDLGEGVTSGSLFGFSTQGLIEVSQDGVGWTPITGVQPDHRFPTLGYTDVAHPWSSPAGASPTDFTRPVDPAFDAAGLSLGQIISGYAGSGGGAGVDIAGTGLGWITHVRITYLGSAGDLQIDALSDVSPIPAPAAPALLLSAGLFAAHRRRR